MARQLRILCLTAFATACLAIATSAARVPQADTPWCRTTGRLVTVHMNVMRGWLSGARPNRVAWRQELGLDGVSPDSIALVTDDSLCARGSAAVDGAVQVPRGSPVYVYRVGPLYAVDDPSETRGYHPILFFDSTFTTRKGILTY